MNKKIIDDLDKYLAILGVIVSLVLIIYLSVSIKRPIYIIIGVFILMAFASWIFLRNKASINLENKFNSSTYLILNIYFFTFLILSILSVYMRSDIYSRPLEYFIFTGIMASLISLEILILPLNKKLINLTLIKIIILGLSPILSQLIIFPSLIGQDGWHHQLIASQIVNSGLIPLNYDYTNLPIFHLLTGSTSMITGLDHKFSSFASISFIQVLINVLFIYLFGKYLFNEKVGLLASLLLILSNYVIYFGSWIIPNTLGLIFFLIVLYLFLKKGNSIISRGLIVLLMGVLVLTHPVASVNLEITLFIAWVTFEFYRYFYSKNIKPIPVTVIFLLFVFMFWWWMYTATDRFSAFVELLKSGFNINLQMNAPQIISSYLSTIPFFQQFFNNIGIFLFFSISLIGILFMISKKYRKYKSFFLATTGFILLFITFLSLTIRHPDLGDRWMAFSQIVLAIPFAIGIILICNRIKNSSLRAISMASLIFVIAFIMIMSPVANIDNYSFSPDTDVRFAFVQSEISAATFVWDHAQGGISVDDDYTVLFTSQYSYNGTFEELLMDDQLFNSKFDQNNKIKVIRNEIVNRPFRLYLSIYKLEYNPNKVLSADFNKIYESNSVSAYL